VLLLFAFTLFVSAALLFWVQPMVAKMLLPLLGGTPAVWNTCMVFFQGMLLAGYAYAHLLTTRVKLSGQVLIHLGIVLVAAVVLPINISERAVVSLPAESDPTFWLLGCLFVIVGLPFFVASASAPLLQKWFSETRHDSASDPYFLYGASNLGSLGALVGYPLLLEPKLRLQEQSWLWAAGYGVFGTLSLLCVWMRYRNEVGRTGVSPVSDRTATSESRQARRLSCQERLRWVLLAFVPSSLMLGATTYITTDIASIPLLWILPLAVYLITFIVAFARRRLISDRLMRRALPIAVVGLIYLLLSEATEPPWLLILLHLLFLFIAALACHGQLATARPTTEHLTEFFLWISVGGVLGGIFNALVAPFVFSRVAEYPIAALIACLLCGSERGSKRRSRGSEALSASESAVRFIGPLGEDQSLVTSAATLGHRVRIFELLLPLGAGGFALLLAHFGTHFSGWPLQARLAMIFGPPLILSYAMVDRPLRFTLALGAVMAASLFYSGTHGRTLHAERNFFGVLRVTSDPNGMFHRLVHGNTVHGRQFVNVSRRCEPLSYYHRTGPLGQLFAIFDTRTNKSNIAVIGLGAGSMASYATPRQTWTFYEINPAVIALARNTNYFSFLTDCLSAKAEMIVGDARLRLRHAANQSYDLLVVDAFSSDAIPMHLITREALDLYLSKLADGGLLAFHISNRNLNLEPVLGALAKNARLVCYANDENEPSVEEQADGKDQSHWIIMARRRENLGKLVRDSRWIPVSVAKDAKIWTDDFSDIVSVFKWE